MRRQARSTTPLRVILLATAAVAALLVTLPGAGSFAAWNASTPLGGTVATGSLGIDRDALTAGAWTKDGAAFDPAKDTLTAGTTITTEVTGVPVIAVGDNLEATFSVSGADVPDGIADHVEVELASDPAPVRGADSDADGHQTVTLTLAVTADGDLPSAAQTIDLSDLTVTLSNGHAWTDTAALDAGTLTTDGGITAPGGTVTLSYDLTQDTDEKVGFYLTNPGPGTEVFWGDYDNGGEITTAATSGLNEHDYTGSGKDTGWIRIVGTFQGLGSADQTVEQIGALTNVEGWTDDIGSTSARNAFLNASNLSYVSALPEGLKDASSAFRNAGTEADSLYIASWTAESATTMAHMFEGATSYTESISWDTSNVTDMSFMFAGATSFSGPISFTSTSRVTTMEGMFQGATSYISEEWSTGSYIQEWDVSNVTTMAHMFDGASAFDRDLSLWNTSNVTDMSFMFRGATAFNFNSEHTAEQPYAEPATDRWDVSKVTTMAHMFDGASAFNRRLGEWDVSQVEDMTAMFKGATTFDQSLENWQTHKVTTMQEMFYGAAAFSQDLSHWNVSNVDNHADFATGAGPLIEPKWEKGIAAPARAESQGQAPADATTDAGGQPTDRPPTAGTASGTTAGATTSSEGTDTDATEDGGTTGASHEETPAPAETVDPEQAVRALEEAWTQAQESATDEALQALEDAADVVDALLGEGSADEIVQRLEDEAAGAATPPSARPMATAEHDQAD